MPIKTIIAEIRVKKLIGATRKENRRKEKDTKNRKNIAP